MLRDTLHRAWRAALLTILLGTVTLAQLNAAPAGAPAGGTASPPGGSLTMGGQQPAPVDPGTAQSQAIGNAGLATSNLPQTQPAASQPATQVSSLYPDLTFTRTNSTRPDPTPRAIPTKIISDAEIEQSIRRGVDLIIDQFNPNNGRLRGRPYLPNYEAMETGLDALCVYALMQAGSATGDERLNARSPFMGRLIDALKDMRADAGMHQTYARGLRATALAFFNRPQDRDQLKEDVACLVQGNFSGGYGYLSAVPSGRSYSFTKTVPQGFPPNWIDHSNTQYGLLGVWSGAEAGIEIPADYWNTAIEHWETTQSLGGRWAYLAPGGPRLKGVSARPPEDRTSLTMTAAGTASLFVAGEYADQAKGQFKCGRDAFSPPLKKALDWWEQGENAVNLRGVEHWGYTLYGVERVGLASGFKFFGSNDWFRRLARQAVDKQVPSGAWGNIIDSAYGLLFLARGRHAVLMNKLRFEGKDEIQPDFWANRPNDVASLARFTSRVLERPMNWQIVPLKQDSTDWLDSPILYIASHQRPRFTNADIEKLRQYVEAGGMIFTNCDRDNAPAAGSLEALAAGGGGERSDEFDKFVAELAGKLFPAYRYADLPADHPLYSSVFKLNATPKLKAVSNGARLLLVHSSQDQAILWQKRDEAKGRSAFEFGANLYVYAAGRQNAHYRLGQTWVPPIDRLPTGAPSIAVARLRYEGNWDPEPRAWERMTNLLAWKTGIDLKVSAVAIKDLKPGVAAVAHLTGTAGYALTPSERSTIKSFVDAGGVLLIDDTGGNGEWSASAQRMLSATFPSTLKSNLTADQAILLGAEPGMTEKLRPTLRLFSREHAPGKPIPLIQVLRSGHGAVVFCPQDLTSGLIGVNAWGIHGYEPASAEALVRNVLFWAVDGRK